MEHNFRGFENPSFPFVISFLCLVGFDGLYLIYLFLQGYRALAELCLALQHTGNKHYKLQNIETSPILVISDPSHEGIAGNHLGRAIGIY